MRRAPFAALTSLLLAASAGAQEPAKPPAASTKPEESAPAKPAEQAAPPDAPEGSTATNVSALQSELSTVLDELIQARTRAAVLGKALFRTRIDISVLRRSDDQQLVHVRLFLDGVPIHDSDGGALANSEEARLFQGHIAPGVHEIGIEITEQAKGSPTYRYTRSERFRIETKKNTSTQVELLLRDDSDMADELPQGDRGAYQVSTRVRVTPVKVGD